MAACPTCEENVTRRQPHQEIGALEVAVNDGRVVHMQAVHATGGVQQLQGQAANFNNTANLPAAQQHDRLHLPTSHVHPPSAGGVAR